MSCWSYLESGDAKRSLGSNYSLAYYWFALLPPEALESVRPAWEAAEEGTDDEQSLPVITLPLGPLRDRMTRFGELLLAAVPAQQPLWREFVDLFADLPDETQIAHDYGEYSYMASPMDAFEELMAGATAVDAGGSAFEMGIIDQLREDPVADGFGVFVDYLEPAAGPVWSAAAEERGYIR